MLLCKARELYELLEVFPSHKKNALNKLFGDVPQQGMYQGSTRAMQVSGMPYMTQQWASAPIGWSQQQAAPSQRPGGPEPLTEPLPDDTFLKRTFGAALFGARDIVGWERHGECLRRLKRSDELVVASSLQAAEPLAALGMRSKDFREREQKEALKLAKKAVRDILLGRCTGNALGLDSREAIIRTFEEACGHTHCVENTVSQSRMATGAFARRLLAALRPKIASQRAWQTRQRWAEDWVAQQAASPGSSSCSYKLQALHQSKKTQNCEAVVIFRV